MTNRTVARRPSGPNLRITYLVAKVYTGSANSSIGAGLLALGTSQPVNRPQRLLKPHHSQSFTARQKLCPSFEGCGLTTAVGSSPTLSLGPPLLLLHRRDDIERLGHVGIAGREAAGLEQLGASILQITRPAVDEPQVFVQLRFCAAIATQLQSFFHLRDGFWPVAGFG